MPPAGGFCCVWSFTSQNASPGVTDPAHVSTGPSATRCMLKIIGSVARSPSSVSQMSSSGHDESGWTEATCRVHFRSPSVAPEDIFAHALSWKEAKSSCLCFFQGFQARSVFRVLFKDGPHQDTRVQKRHRS